MTKTIFELVRDPDTPPEVFIKVLNNEHYSRGWSWTLWYDISINPSTPAEALNKLADLCLEKGYYSIVKRITKHPNTPTTTKQYIQAKIYLTDDLHPTPSCPRS